jgi:hypothetical protein
MKVQWLRCLTGGLSQQRPTLNPRSVIVQFLLDTLALGQVLHIVLLSDIIIMPPVFLIHVSSAIDVVDGVVILISIVSQGIKIT